MHYTPREFEKLLFSQAGRLAHRRLAGGKKLNHLEATARITTALQEIIHDGHHSVTDLMTLGKKILGRRHVHPSVVGTLKQMQVEGTFDTGTHLITIHHPISTDGSWSAARWTTAMRSMAWRFATTRASFGCAICGSARRCRRIFGIPTFYAAAASAGSRSG
ncbi:hypothetical protein PWT90_07011 [Aphanocladium album]|nr:hypothetical protein PWT90_07011 [Aphanocladium album]